MFNAFELTSNGLCQAGIKPKHSRSDSGCIPCTWSSTCQEFHAFRRLTNSVQVGARKRGAMARHLHVLDAGTVQTATSVPGLKRRGQHPQELEVGLPRLSLHLSISHDMRVLYWPHHRANQDLLNFLRQRFCLIWSLRSLRQSPRSHRSSHLDFWSSWRAFLRRLSCVHAVALTARSSV